MEKLNVGGQIFHIVDGDNWATYHFYDENGNELENVKIGDTPYTYTVEGTPTFDKYYVFKNQNYTGLMWSNDIDTIIGTTDGIGTGKSNTDLALTKYSNVSNCIWEKVKQLNDAVTDGCNDWFVGSKAELEELRKSNLASSYFNSYYIWSSFEYSASEAWYWYFFIEWSYSYKGDDSRSNGLIVIRAF